MGRLVILCCCHRDWMSSYRIPSVSAEYSRIQTDICFLAASFDIKIYLLPCCFYKLTYQIRMISPATFTILFIIVYDNMEGSERTYIVWLVFQSTWVDEINATCSNLDSLSEIVVRYVLVGVCWGNESFQYNMLSAYLASWTIMMATAVSWCILREGAFLMLDLVRCVRQKENG